MTVRNKLNIALSGSGRIDRVHAVNIAAHPGVNLARVADASVDAVVVCSPGFADPVRHTRAGLRFCLLTKHTVTSTDGGRRRVRKMP